MNEILQGDVLQVLRTLPDNYVQCVVTSPKERLGLLALIKG